MIFTARLAGQGQASDLHFLVELRVFSFRTCEWGVSRHRNTWAVTVCGCRKHAWSSPLLLPRAAPRARYADGKLTLRVHGKLHHIGIGRACARTPVLMLVHDLHIRVINAATGELLRDLTLDPARDYQPTGQPPGPKPKRPRT